MIWRNGQGQAHGQHAADDEREGEQALERREELRHSPPSVPRRYWRAIAIR